MSLRKSHLIMSILMGILTLIVGNYYTYNGGWVYGPFTFLISYLIFAGWRRRLNQ